MAVSILHPPERRLSCLSIHGLSAHPADDELPPPPRNRSASLVPPAPMTPLSVVNGAFNYKFGEESPPRPAKKLPIFKLLLIVGILCLTVLLIVLVRNGQFGMLNEEKETEKNFWSQLLGKIDLKKRIKPEFDRFLFTEPMEGPLANQIYRYGSLFAIAKFLNRTPVFAHNDVTVEKLDALMEKTFPNFYQRIYFLNEDFKGYEQSAFSIGCCDYQDPEKLLAYNNSRVLMLTGDPELENPKYFQHIRPTILKIFEFAPEMVKRVEAIGKLLLKNDKIPKICMHTRTGDLGAFGQLKTHQLAKAIQRMLNMMPRIIKNRTKPSQYSLFIFGEAKSIEESIKSVNGNQTMLHQIYHVVDANLSEAEQLLLAQQSCDFALLTDSLSPFAFWMGFLLPEDRPVFYVRKQIEMATVKVDTMESLPSDWIPIDESWLKK